VVLPLCSRRRPRGGFRAPGERRFRSRRIGYLGQTASCTRLLAPGRERTTSAVARARSTADRAVVDQSDSSARCLASRFGRRSLHRAGGRRVLISSAFLGLRAGCVRGFKQLGGRDVSRERLGVVRLIQTTPCNARAAQPAASGKSARSSASHARSDEQRRQIRLGEGSDSRALLLCYSGIPSRPRSFDPARVSWLMCRRDRGPRLSNDLVLEGTLDRAKRVQILDFDFRTERQLPFWPQRHVASQRSWPFSMFASLTPSDRRIARASSGTRALQAALCRCGLVTISMTARRAFEVDQRAARNVGSLPVSSSGEHARA